MAPKSVLLSS